MSSKNKHIIYLLTFLTNPMTKSIVILSLFYLLSKSFENHIYADFQCDIDSLQESETPVTVQPLLTVDKFLDFIVPNEHDSELVGVTKSVGIIILGLSVCVVLGCIIDCF